MKQYPWKFKLLWNGIKWGQSEKILGTDDYFYYFHWCFMDRDMRDAYRELENDSWFEKVFGLKTIGLHRFWYDGPHAQLNLYYICFYWSTRWTNPPKEYRRKPDE